MAKNPVIVEIVGKGADFNHAARFLKVRALAESTTQRRRLRIWAQGGRRPWEVLTGEAVGITEES